MINIGVDIDGVIYDIIGASQEIFAENYGIRFGREAITIYDIAQSIPAITPKMVEEVFWEDDKVYKSGELLNRQLLFSLKGLNANITLVTARPRLAEDATVAWLDEHKLPANDLVFSQDKASVARTRGITHFIEDNINHAVALSSVCKAVYLISTSYNRSPYYPGDNIMRVMDSKQIIADLARRREMSVF
jgi:uncharacterized HAD superfamily protein